VTFKIADRVKDTTTTTGTGTLTLSGTAPAGFQSFNSGIGDGNSTCYCIKDANGTGWEVGIGTYTNSGTTLSRTTILASSNSGSAITLSSGTHSVFVTEPAAAGVRGLFGGQMTMPVPTSANTGLTTTSFIDSASVADSAAGVTISQPSGASADRWSLISKAVASPPYSYTALVTITSLVTGSNIAGVGFGWYDGAKFQIIRLISQTAATWFELFVSSYTNTTTFSANNSVQNNYVNIPVFLKILDDNSGTVFFQYSNDGANFETLYSVAKASGFLGSGGYSNVCFGCESKSAHSYATMMSFSQGTT
jgi:hypothetical protein